MDGRQVFGVSGGYSNVLYVKAGDAVRGYGQCFTYKTDCGYVSPVTIIRQAP